MTALREIITVDGASWTQDIVPGIRSRKIIVKNWLSVRGVMQELINSGEVKRTDDITVEVYVALSMDSLIDKMTDDLVSKVVKITDDLVQP